MPIFKAISDVEIWWQNEGRWIGLSGKSRNFVWPSQQRFTRLNVNFTTAAILEKKPAPNQIKFSSKSFLRKSLHTASCNTLPGGIYNIAKFPESNLYALQELLQ